MPAVGHSPPSAGGAVEDLGSTYSVTEMERSGTGAVRKTGAVGGAGGFDTGKCGVCERKVGAKQRGISCDICERWYHSECVQLTAVDYEYYSSKGDDTVWVCRSCRGNVKGMSRRMEKLERENQLLRKENESVMNKFQMVIDKIEGLREEIAGRVKAEVMECMNAAIDRKIENKMKDEEDKRKRECNVVVHGLREGNDKVVCEGIIQQQLQLQDIPVESVVRLGRGGGGNDVQGRPRPLLVKFSSPGQKWAVVGRAKRLRNADDESLRRVMIVPDMSMDERMQDKRLRDELKRRRDNGERDVYISRGQIRRRVVN